MVSETYRVLAADDEYWICENLRHIIPWKDYGLTFLEPASDGEEVLQRIEEEHVDILITDINMPYINGLELLKEIHEKYPQVVTMVLSGYDDFPKVKGAFMEGSINYLLKPVNKSDLINTLSQAIEMIGVKKARSTKQEKERIQAQRVSSFLQDNEFSRMLIKKSDQFIPNIVMPGHMEAGDIDMILLKFHDMETLNSIYEHDMLRISYEVKRKIKEAALMENMFIFNYSYRINEFLLCGRMEKNIQHKIANVLMHLFPQEKVGPVSIILDQHAFMLENLNTAYQDAISVLMTRTFDPKSIVMEQNGVKEEEMFDDILSMEEEREIMNYIKKNDKKGLEKYIFYHIGIAQSVEKGWSLIRMRQTVRKLMNFLSSDQTVTLSVNQTVNCEALAQVADQEIGRLNLEEVLNQFQELFRNIFVENKKDATESVKDSIHKAIKYVDKNYMENLTLNMIANKFHVEPTYFSRLFRQESGENLIPYMTKRRLDAAVGLMNKRELSLTEISFLVGYEDYAYFNRVFRKYMGCSPKDYRQQEVEKS